ncbi:transposase [Sphingobium sp. BS19]|uniref:IS66-like element accessory protein TnpA n=1 Tax=Sphingobium sp. BS19 TaxID=3018973 RepID=UPI0022EDA143|nr:transposase [Sphingobium sp. BS19]GLJ00578.1 transposase [Sphingobium sp. BS19]
MEILGRERRRRWTEAEKLEIVAAVGVNGETLSRVARHYDVSRAQIYSWRHAFKKKGQRPALSGPTFLPVDIAPSMLAAPDFEERVISASIVELFLAQGRRLRFDSGIEGTTLVRLVRSIEGA